MQERKRHQRNSRSQLVPTSTMTRLPTEQNESTFKAAIQKALAVTPETIESDGSIHRFADATDGTKGKRSAWYVFHGTHGAFGTWHDSAVHLWHNGDRPQPPSTPEEKAVTERAWMEKQILENSLKAAAARKANMLVNGATETEDHDYLKQKQIGAGLVSDDDDNNKVVVVPLSSDGTNVINAQVIHPNGEKRFQAGGRVKETFHVIGDPETAKRILLCEGYATGRSLHLATAHPVICAMNCGNLAAVARRINELWPKAEVLVCADNDRMTSGNPGVTHGMEAAKEIKARFAVPVFSTGADGTDYNDLHVTEGLDTARTQIEQAWYGEPVKYSEAEVTGRLLHMDASQYQSERRQWSDYLGRKLADLDGMIEAHRTAPKKTVESEVEQSWPDPVDGAGLLVELRDAIQRHVVLEQVEAVASALWITHTYVYETAQCLTPILNITSATKRCGKSTLLSLLNKLVKSPKASAGISGPAIYRTIELHRPTLLIDEADNVVSKEKMDLLGVLNAGISPETAKVTRCCGDDLQPKDFDCYCAKVLAGIGARIDTLEDRSITITLRRKSREMKVQRVRQFQPGDLRRKLVRWSDDNGKTIADAYQTARTTLPDALNDRQQDCWEILFAVADRAGGDWPKTARNAAILLCGRLDAETSLPEMLLADCHRYHLDSHQSKVGSKALVDWLNGQEERPWKDLRHGNGIDQRRLATMLAGFGLSSKNLKIGTEVVKGYDFEQFADAFKAYLDPAGLAATERYSATDPDFTGVNMVADKKGDPLPSATSPLPQNPNVCRPSSAVADKNGKTGYVEDYV